LPSTWFVAKCPPNPWSITRVPIAPVQFAGKRMRPVVSSAIGRRYSSELPRANYLEPFENKKKMAAWKLIGGAMAEHSFGHKAASQAALDELIRKHSATRLSGPPTSTGGVTSATKRQSGLSARTANDGGMLYGTWRN
jgi:hypothetical protein